MNVDNTSQGYKLAILLLLEDRSCLKQKCKLMLVTTMENYNPFLITLEIFWKNTCQQQKMPDKPKRQATLTDMFSRAFSSKLMSTALFVIFLK